MKGTCAKVFAILVCLTIAAHAQVTPEATLHSLAPALCGTDIAYCEIVGALFPLEPLGGHWPSETSWRIAIRKLPALQEPIFLVDITKTWDGSVGAEIVSSDISVYSWYENLVVAGTAPSASDFGQHLNHVSLDSTSTPELVKVAAELEHFDIPIVPPRGLVVDMPTYQVLSEAPGGMIVISETLLPNDLAKLVETLIVAASIGAPAASEQIE